MKINVKQWHSQGFSMRVGVAGVSDGGKGVWRQTLQHWAIFQFFNSKALKIGFSSFNLSSLEKAVEVLNVFV